MSRTARLGGCLLLLVARAVAQDFHDDFNDLAGWNDLSTAITWGGYAGPVSAFTNEGGRVTLTAAAVANSGYTTASSLKTFTALDRQFAEPINHRASIVTIDFKAHWPAQATDAGDSGRFMVVLNHAYPTDGLSMVIDEKYNDLSEHWWARPSYHLRIRNGSSGTSMLLYGGGHDDLGEFEKYQSQWCLAGFISGAGGKTPANTGELDFPSNSWVQTVGSVVSSTPRLYRYVVAPDRQQLFVDGNGNDAIEAGELRAEMLLPEMTNAPLYHYFEQFEGLRLYWRGAKTNQQALLDWLTLSVEHLDTDGDGIEDRWEWRHFGETNALDGALAADPDRDGLSNEGEYWAGTDPTNAASVLGWRVIAPGVGDALVLAWPSVTDRVYRVRAATNLDLGFDQVITAGMAATPPWNAVTTRHDAFPRWYRIELDPD